MTIQLPYILITLNPYFYIAQHIANTDVSRELPKNILKAVFERTMNCLEKSVNTEFDPLLSTYIWNMLPTESKYPHEDGIMRARKAQIHAIEQVFATIFPHQYEASEIANSIFYNESQDLAFYLRYQQMDLTAKKFVFNAITRESCLIMRSWLPMIIKTINEERKKTGEQEFIFPILSLLKLESQHTRFSPLDIPPPPFEPFEEELKKNFPIDNLFGDVLMDNCINL